MENLSVKNVKLHADLSEETTCFTADVYKDGKLFAHGKNNGGGGCSIYYPAKGFSPKDTAYLMGTEVDCYIMGLVEEYDFVTKNQSKALVLREINAKVKDFPNWATAKLNASIAKLKKSPTYPVWLERQRESLRKQGYEIINRNL